MSGIYSSEAVKQDFMMDLSLHYEFGPGLVLRNRVLRLEQALMEQPDNLSPEEATEKYNTHFFAPGVYGRKMFIPAGMCIVGKIHKHAHINVVMRGVVKVVTEFGEETITAPHVWVSVPGTKRAVFALEDTEWMTFHHNPTDTQDLKEIEDYVIAPDFETLNRLKLESGSYS